MRKFFQIDQSEQGVESLIRTVIGICPVLFVATSGLNGLILALCALVLLTAGFALISLLKPFVSEKVCPITSVVIFVALAALLDMIVHAAAVKAYASLDISILLLGIGCYIASGAGAYATAAPCVGCAGMEGLKKGLIFALVIFLVSAICEMYGTNTLFGAQVFGNDFSSVGIMTLIAGSFVVLALLVAAVKAFNKKEEGEE